MKIYTMEVVTDLGRRVVQLEGPLDVDPIGDMPLHFRSLTEVLWRVLVSAQGTDLTAPKAEA